MQIGWSTEIAIKLAPNIVSGLVVNTVKLSSDFDNLNLISHPNVNVDVKKRYNSQCVANFSNHEICQVSFFNKFTDELKELERYVEENDLASILKLWKHRSYDKGTQIQVSDNKGGVNSGTFLGLDELGGLILRHNSGIKKIYSGDVYFGS